MPVVNADQSSGRAGDVVEEFLDDVDRCAELRLIGCECSAEVMERPVGRVARFVQYSFGLAPAVERGIPASRREKKPGRCVADYGRS